MDSSYAAQYRALFEQHWWWRARESAVLDLVRDRCRPDRPCRILDVGCGDALLFDQLAPWGEVHGVEVCEALISPDNRWRSQIYVGPFDELYQPAKPFDLVLMLDVLEHFADPRAALDHAYRLLTPGGSLLIHVPAFRTLWTAHDDLNHHYTRFTQTTLGTLLTSSSFDVAHMQYTFYWTCPVKLAIRLKEKLLTTKSRPARVPPHWINRLCYYLCRCEQRLFGRRSPGFGSSILALACKPKQASPERDLARESPVADAFPPCNVPLTEVEQITSAADAAACDPPA